MTARIQTQRLQGVGQLPPNGARPFGELWLNVPDRRLGMIDPTQAPIDLLPIRAYAPSAGYAAGDFVVNAGQLLQAKAAIVPKPFAATDWNAYQSTAQNDGRYLAITGGSLTGPLTLAGNPTTATQAANKSYVDSTAAAGDATVHAYVDTTVAKYLPLTGGTLTGPLGVGGHGVSYPGLGWSHLTAIGWDGTNFQAAGDGSYIGALALQSWVSGHYLALTGGALTGPLTLNSGLTFSWLGADAHAISIGWDGNLQVWVDGTYVAALATTAMLAGYLPLAGGTVSGTLDVSSGRVISYNANNNPAFTCYNTTANYACGMWCDPQANLVFGGIDGAGNPVVAYGCFNTGGTLYVAGDVGIGNYGGTPTMQLLVGGTSCGIGFTSWVLAFGESDGTLAWYPPSQGALFWCEASGVFHAANFVAYSDVRGKTNVVPTDCGLPAVLQLNPVSFRRLTDPDHSELGFIAQDVAEVIPEAVREGRARATDDAVLGLLLTPIVAALVNAAKTFDQRLRVLEGDLRP
jgi:hypothetical protein